MSEKRIASRQKRVVMERARGCCEYCRSQVRFAMQAFSVEHIEPRSRGGETRLDNLALACQGCNNHKYIRIEAPDPVTHDIVPLYHPRRQRWREHFTWNEGFILVIGLTPTGRATVEALQLNREGLVNMRGALHAMGEHPPSDELDSRNM